MGDTVGAGPNHIELFEIASEQLGYFTAAQARASGFSSSLLGHHTQSGRFLRIRRGLYRIRDYPSSPREDVMVAWLAVGKDAAVVSHESALDLLDLSNVILNTVHLIVPRSKRNLPSVPNATIHTTTRALRPDETTVRDGIRLTAPARAIVDAAESGVAPEQIEMAIGQALERGLTTAEQLRQAASQRSSRVCRLIGSAINLTTS